jgi:hypothetical protein
MFDAGFGAPRAPARRSLMKNLRVWKIAMAAFLLSATARGQEPAEEPQSPAMMYTGAALTIVGGANLVAGNVALFVIGDSGGDMAGLAAFVIGGSILTGASVLLHVGIPLWAVGASHDDRPRFMPVLGLAPGSAQLRWQF